MSTILAAASSAPSAAALADAGVDRIIAYHSSAYRTRGLPSVAGLLPWASANQQTLDLLPGVVSGAASTPVIATVSANDGMLPRAEMIDAIRAEGAVGVLNAPTVGFYQGVLRSVLDAEGLGRDSELALIQDASAADLESWAYVFDPEWTRLAAEAGATGVIVHLGITGYPSPTDAAACVEAARSAGAQRILLHGGNLVSPAEFTTTLADFPPLTAGAVSGYMGASVFERASDVGQAVRQWRAAISRSDAVSTPDDGGRE